ncbi:AI-2E family transporter [Ramlibacter sp. AW1]|uniref:AI-2E family transporter n=1 Tax=Ramlibacter aurantiacus TaxID=2801330 RepID=A0A937D3U9_9BURK|nr:AI-2E family transporter [Ramlibacter aurantiacus]MBL0419707.1 AI-2E family transporter [Ramlibacter aurantiacus]
MPFVSRVLVALALGALLVLAWWLRQVGLLVFGAVIVAVIVSGAADWINRLAAMRHQLAVLVTVIVAMVLLSSLVWFIGVEVSDQVETLRDNFDDAIAKLRAWLGSQPLGSRVLSLWDRATGDGLPWPRLASAAGLTITVVLHLLLVLTAGIYLAAERRLYHDGLLRLFPVDRRDLADAALRCAGQALAGWLRGQGIAMVFVGLFTWIGLALVGAPLPVVLALLAGLLEFVPFFGPLVAGVLAVVFAFTVGPETALYVAVVMLAVQQLEAYVVTPLAQRWTVRLPPVLGLVAVLVFGTLLGLGGVLLATPMMVVLMVLVRQLYVEHYLESRPVDAGP